ncbi:MAG: LysR family transcriptional regulator [Rhodospirillales bacterium]|nr:LysR family transcriptional regulator [Rhodospirillales bacterium]
MELRPLRYFLAVADELHFGRAAERLGMAQPPLSQQIRKLERTLGVALFVRSKRRVELSEAGRVLREEAGRLLIQAERAVLAAQRAGRGEAGNLRVGYTSTCAFSPVVLDVLRRYQAAHEGVVLGLAEMHTSDQLSALLDGRIDAAFVRSPVSDQDERYAALTLLHEPLVAALPASHPRAATAAIELADLRAEPFILFPRAAGSGLFDGIIAACRKAGFDPDIVQEAPQFTSIIGLVSAGLGISLVPEALRQLRLDAVVYRPLSGTPVTAPVALVVRRRVRSPAVTAFVRTARDVIARAPVRR